jgi:uncharacterized protein (TIGR03435 family)
MVRVFAGIGFIALLSGAIFGQASGVQAAEPLPTFDIADVHESPHTTTPNMRGGVLRSGRYEILTANMVDLIRTAYSVDADKVLGGPNWLEWDRFDVIAKAPPSTPPQTVKLMLQALLVDRFRLVLHRDLHPLPAYGLTVGKGGSKLKEADAAGETGCKYTTSPTPAEAQAKQAAAQSGGTPSIVLPTYLYECHNMTMGAFAEGMRNMLAAQNYLTAGPAVDQTGLKGAWDFNFKYTPKIPPALAAQISISGEPIPLFDALDKQLGLKLDPVTYPTPVLIVDSVNQKPSANPPGVTTALPPSVPTEFEVADIRPSEPNAAPAPSSVQNGRISLRNIALKDLVSLALNVNSDDMLVGAPKSMDSAHFDLIAKLPATADTPTQGIDIDALRPALKVLLEERFKLKTHMEDRPVDAYTLTAPKPKLKKADPLLRTSCKEGPGTDGRDPRDANPTNSRLLTCQNMTMAQLAEQLQLRAGGYVRVPILDATGLEGAYDFTLNFATAGVFQNGGGVGRGGDRGAAAGDTPGASDPNGAISLPDAVSKQLGLKLELKKRPIPVIVIDHIDEKPTDN